MERDVRPCRCLSLWGLVTAGGALAGSASLLGFLGGLHWFLDICAHFRVQYTLSLGAAAVLLLLPRRFGAAAIFAALAVANLAVILPLFVGRQQPPPGSGAPLRVMLINVNTATGDPAAVSRAIRACEPDVVLFEETNARWLAELSPALTTYPHTVAEPRPDNFAIALFSRFPLAGARIADIGPAGVPSVVADVHTPHGTFTLLGTHPLPPVGRARSDLRNGQLAALPAVVRGATSPVLLLGDLNVSPWSSHFRRLLRESGLRDSARGWGVQASWPTTNPLLRIPLDHGLHGPGIVVVGRRLGPRTGSDHFPLIVDFVLEGGAGTRESD